MTDILVAHAFMRAVPAQAGRTTTHCVHTSAQDDAASSSKESALPRRSVVRVHTNVSPARTSTTACATS